MAKETIIRELDEGDAEQVRTFDVLSGDDVEDMLDCPGYAYGAFAPDGELLAYCTIGGADCVETEMIEGHPSYGCDSLLLSDVFTHPRHRRQCIADALIEHVLEANSPHGTPSVYLQLLDDELARLYARHGFEWCDGTESYCMVRDSGTVET